MSSKDRWTHYQVLDIELGASEEDIRRAWRKMRGLFDADSVALYGLYRSIDVQNELARLQRAYEILLDPVARRRYDRRIFPKGQVSRIRPAGERTEARSAVSRPEPPADPLAAAGVAPTAPITGAVLAKVRTACSIELEEIAERTKISMFTLRCIETDQFGDLPATVYLRGFLKQIASHLGLPPDRVMEEYMAAMAAWQAARQKKRPW